MSPTEPAPTDSKQWPNIKDDEMEAYHDLFMAAYLDEAATAAFRRLGSHGIHAMSSLFAARAEVASLRAELEAAHEALRKSDCISDTVREYQDERDAALSSRPDCWYCGRPASDPRGPDKATEPPK